MIEVKRTIDFNYLIKQELEGSRHKRKSEEARCQQQKRKGSDPNSKNSHHRRHEQTPEEIELKAVASSESRRCDAGDCGDCNLNRSSGTSLTSVPIIYLNDYFKSKSEKYLMKKLTTLFYFYMEEKENRRKQMLDAVERRHQKHQRLDAIVQRKRNREEAMERRERELAKMGGANLRVEKIKSAEVN